MSDRPNEEAPASIEPSMPEEPQTSVHYQGIQPEPATSDAEPGANERTMAEEELRRRHSGEHGDAPAR